MIRVSAEEGYRIWAAEYDDTPNPLLALEERTLEKEGRQLATGLVLDVGCGTGRWARLLAGAPYVGVDFCVEMIRRGDCAAGDASALPICDGAAQLTICSFLLGYIERPGRAVAELARATRPGGFVILSDLDPEAAWRRTFHAHGVAYELEHWAHSPAIIREAASRAGMALVREHRPVFGEPERNIFRSAGREDLFERAAGVPAIWVTIWRRL